MKVQTTIIVLLTVFSLIGFLAYSNANKKASKKIIELEQKINKIHNEYAIKSVKDSIDRLVSIEKQLLNGIEDLKKESQYLTEKINKLKPVINNYAIYQIQPTYADSSDAAIKSRLFELADSIRQYPVN